MQSCIRTSEPGNFGTEHTKIHHIQKRGKDNGQRPHHINELKATEEETMKEMPKHIINEHLASCCL